MFILVVYGHVCYFLANTALANDDRYIVNDDLYADRSDIIMKVTSAVSIAACIPVILVFGHTKLRQKPFIQVIVFIQLCNFFTSTGTVMGYQSDGPSCMWQAISTGMFPVSCSFWTTYILYMIYNIVLHDVLVHVNYKVHCICWLFPLLVTLLPYINAGYGAPDGYGWCFVVSIDQFLLTLW